MLHLSVSVEVVGGTVVTADFYATPFDALVIGSHCQAAATQLAAQAIRDEWLIAAETLGIDVREPGLATA